MTPRERVATTLNHETPHRCPFQASFMPKFAARLRAGLAHQDRSHHNPHGGGNTYELERALKQDMLLTSVGWANAYYQDTQPYVDEWGVGWDIQPYETPFGRGHYTEIKSHPLADASAIDHYQPPDPCRPERYDAARQVSLVVDVAPEELQSFMDAMEPAGLFLCIAAQDEAQELAIIDRLLRWV